MTAMRLSSPEFSSGTTLLAYRRPWSDAGTVDRTTGYVVGAPVLFQVQVTESRRPGLARRAAMESTSEGRARLEAARRDLGSALAADGLVDLAALRMKTGRSQEQLAAVLGISQPALSKIESATQAMKSDTIHRLALALGVSEQEVIDAHRRTQTARQASDVRVRRP